MGGGDECKYVWLIYHGVTARTAKPGVSGHNILLAASIWRNRRWFLVAVAWSHSVWVVVIDVGMLGLMLVRVKLRKDKGHWGYFSH